MRTIYVIVSSVKYEPAPRLLRAFAAEDQAQIVKEMIDACGPSRTVEVVPVQLEDDRPQPTAIGVFLSAMEEAIGKADDQERRTGGPVNGTPHAADPPEAFVPVKPDVSTAA